MLLGNKFAVSSKFIAGDFRHVCVKRSYSHRNNYERLDRAVKIRMTYLQRDHQKRQMKLAPLFCDKEYMDAAELLYLKSDSKQGWYTGPGVRRAQVWSKIIWQECVDILNDGEFDLSFPGGKKLVVSKVSMTPNLSILNIHWLGEGSDNDDVMEKKLKEIAKPLRCKLIHSSMVGAVPPIKFVKDMSRNNWQNIMRLLAKADYGEDYRPAFPVLNEMKEQNETLESTQEDDFKSTFMKMANRDHAIRRKFAGLGADCQASILQSSTNRTTKNWNCKADSEEASSAAADADESTDAQSCSSNEQNSGAETADSFSAAAADAKYCNYCQRIHAGALRAENCAVSSKAAGSSQFAYSDPQIGRVGCVNYQKLLDAMGASRASADVLLPYDVSKVDLVTLTRPPPRDKQLRLKVRRRVDRSQDAFYEAEYAEDAPENWHEADCFRQDDEPES